MRRFKVKTLENGNYGVVDTTNNKFVRFGYNNPPLYGNEEWQNWYSANGFADKLSRKLKTERTNANDR